VARHPAPSSSEGCNKYVSGAKMNMQWGVFMGPLVRLSSPNASAVSEAPYGRPKLRQEGYGNLRSAGRQLV
jgi:hypothetical protein